MTKLEKKARELHALICELDTLTSTIAYHSANHVFIQPVEIEGVKNLATEIDAARKAVEYYESKEGPCIKFA